MDRWLERVTVDTHEAVMELRVLGFACDEEFSDILKRIVPEMFCGIGVMDAKTNDYMDRAALAIEGECQMLRLARSCLTWRSFAMFEDTTGCGLDEDFKAYMVLEILNKTLGQQMFLHIELMFQYRE